MTKLLEQAIAKVRLLPPEQQDEAGRMLLEMAAEQGAPIVLSDTHRAEVRQGLGELQRGELASPKELAQFRAKHGL